MLLLGPWQLPPGPAGDDALKAQAPLSMAERVLARSGEFLGEPYTESPLGEGAEPDPDPRLRFDAFDCLTYTETVLALARSTSVSDVEPNLDRIRYSGEPSWAHRNHVMEANWIPNAISSGWLKDVTRAVGGARVRRVHKKLDAAAWSSAQGRALHLAASERAQGTYAIDIVPVAEAEAVLRRAPAGLVVTVVRKDRPASVTRISHVGFLVQTPRGPALRHASRTHHRVVDEPVHAFLKRNLDFGAWTIEGLSLYEPLPPVTR